MGESCTTASDQRSPVRAFARETKVGGFCRWQLRWPRRPIEELVRSIVAMGAPELWNIFSRAHEFSLAGLRRADAFCTQPDYQNMLVQHLITSPSEQLKIAGHYLEQAAGVVPLSQSPRSCWRVKADCVPSPSSANEKFEIALIVLLFQFHKLS